MLKIGKLAACLSLVLYACWPLCNLPRLSFIVLYFLIVWFNATIFVSFHRNWRRFFPFWRVMVCDPRFHPRGLWGSWRRFWSRFDSWWGWFILSVKGKEVGGVIICKARYWHTFTEFFLQLQKILKANTCLYFKSLHCSITCWELKMLMLFLRLG